LAESDDHAVGLIFTEFIIRRQLGQTPGPNEWLNRFPRWRERLASLFAGEDVFTVTTEVAPTERSFDSRPPAVTAPGPGTIFASYELLDRLGEGGMGIVYRAWDATLSRTVALKMIRDGALAGEVERERFMREARAAAQLQHPNIVVLHEFGRHEGYNYFTMALASGGNLRQHQKRFCDPRTAAALLEKIARAVHCAHEKGIVHRDLKPGNILLDERDEPLVADFGLVKFLGSDTELTLTGEALGTAAYMAPEQAAGRAHEATARTDTWALGAILYELTTARRPFLANTRKELEHLILLADPLRPRRLCPALDRDLETIILTCLAKEPAQRYVSAEALADDLRSWLDGEPIAARPEPSWRRLWRTVRRHSVAVTAVALSLIFLAVLGLMAWLMHGSSDPAPVDPEEAFRTILHSGDLVPLIGDSGMPKRSISRLGEVAVKMPPDGDGAATISALGEGLLELVSDPFWDSYIFEAELRQDLCLNGLVGLYFCDSSRPSPMGADHSFWVIHFADHGMYAGRFQGYGRRTWGPNSRKATRAVDVPFAPAPGEWRKLRVKVTPEVFEVSWNGVVVRTIPRAEIDAATALGQEDGLPAVLFAPRQSLGIYIKDSSASVRRVNFQPLR
jgi:serine/threonine protein kinase